MNGGLSVLGDVYKSDCYKLAAYINREEENNTDKYNFKTPICRAKTRTKRFRQPS
jgi:hypothetical protein